MKVKTPTTGQLKKRADELASLYYRAETPYCEAQGKHFVSCGGGLQWAHIFTRSILHMRYEPYNKLVLCAGHHRWFGYHPIEWTRFLEQHYPDRLAEAEANRNRYAKPNYEYWIDRFQN